MIIEENILKEIKEVWPNSWEHVIESFEKKEETFQNLPDHVKEKVGTPIQQLIKRMESMKAHRVWESKVVEQIIPKEKLEDGVVYLAMEGTSSLCRCVQEARWDASKQKFMYERTKFAWTFEDEMDHFADVVNGSIAGFTPFKKKE